MIVIVSHNIESENVSPNATKVYQVAPEKMPTWANRFGELMEDETLDGYTRLWYKTPSGGTTVVEYLVKEDK